MTQSALLLALSLCVGCAAQLERFEPDASQPDAGGGSTGKTDGGASVSDAGERLVDAGVGCFSVPAKAGLVDVTAFGARGDGVTDDTAAILRAIDPAQTLTGPFNDAGVVNPLIGAVYWNRPVYFPPGTYLVSQTLEKKIKDKLATLLGLPEGRYYSGLILLGACQGQTIIRLKDHAPGFSDPTTPKAVIFTASSWLGGGRVIDADQNLLPGKTAADVLAASRAGGKDYAALGEGNDAYLNFIENLTIDVGSGNAGAIGLDFVGSNVAGIRNVAIVSTSGVGVTGLSMKRWLPGPFSVRNLLVRGFDVGIDVAQPEYSAVFEGIRIEGARVSGVRNSENALVMRQVSIESSGEALTNSATGGMITLVDGRLALAAGAPGADAASNLGFLHLRNVQVSGYQRFLGAPAPSAPVTGIFDGHTQTAHSATASWSLPVKDAPEPFLEPASAWADVTDFGADPSGRTDSTLAIQAALQSAKATVFFPNGTYLVNANMTVPASVRRIVGFFSTIRKNRANHVDSTKGLFRVINDSNSFTVENLLFDNSNLGTNIAFEHLGHQSFVVRDAFNSGILTVLRAASGGELFIENIAGPGATILGSAGVWARQYNSEGGGTRLINNGANLWVLGLKTEGACTAVLNASADASSEVLGGFVYNVVTSNPEVAAFKNVNGKLLVSFVEEAFTAQTAYSILVQDVRAGVSTNHGPSEFPARVLAGRSFAPRMVPVFSTDP